MVINFKKLEISTRFIDPENFHQVVIRSQSKMQKKWIAISAPPAKLMISGLQVILPRLFSASTHLRRNLSTTWSPCSTRITFHVCIQRRHNLALPFPCIWPQFSNNSFFFVNSLLKLIRIRYSLEKNPLFLQLEPWIFKSHVCNHYNLEKWHFSVGTEFKTGVLRWS